MCMYYSCLIQINITWVSKSQPIMATQEQKLPRHFLSILQENRRKELQEQTGTSKDATDTKVPDEVTVSTEPITDTEITADMHNPWHHNKKPSVEELLAHLNLSHDHLLREDEDQSLSEKHVELPVNNPPSSRLSDHQQLPSVFDYYCNNDTTYEDNEFDYVLEVYGFRPSLYTKDLLKELHKFGSSKMKLKWVDDAHALAIYSTPHDARVASKAPYSLIKVKPLADSTHPESKVVAQKVAESMRDSLSVEKGLPVKGSHDRPQTTSSVARRMVGHALGVKINVTTEQKMQEKLQIEKAKEDKSRKKNHE